MYSQRSRVKGAYVIDLGCRADDRGFFVRAWCQKEFEAHGLTAQLAQVNMAVSARGRERSAGCITNSILTMRRRWFFARGGRYSTSSSICVASRRRTGTGQQSS